MPFFSVIIPLYNKENYVQKSIESVLMQSFSDFEIIIVDDCSTDNSLSMVKNMVSDKIRIIKHETNKGLSASRNTGIKNSNAKYLTFLDADDIWESDFLKQINSLIQKFPEAKLFATNYTEVYPNNLRILPKTTLKRSDTDGIVPDFFESSLGQPLYCACSVCIENSVFDKVGYYDENITFAEDMDFNIRANTFFQLAYSNKASVDYIMFSENQITNSNFKNKVIPNFDAYESKAAANPSLKKYLDFNRYVFAKKYKLENDFENYMRLTDKIDFKNLNWKQSLLLKLPLFILQSINKAKLFLVKKGFKITSYSS